MLPSWSTMLTDFRTIFVFALGPFLPMKVIFFDINGNFNGKMAEIDFWKFPQLYPQLHLKWLPTWEGVELQRKQNVF